MLKYNLYLSNDHVRILRKLSKNGVSVSEHIRSAIGEYLTKKMKESLKISLSPSEK